MSLLVSKFTHTCDLPWAVDVHMSTEELWCDTPIKPPFVSYHGVMTALKPY